MTGPPILPIIYSPCTSKNLLMISWYRRSIWHYGLSSVSIYHSICWQYCAITTLPSVAGPPILPIMYSPCTLKPSLMISWYRRSIWHYGLSSVSIYHSIFWQYCAITALPSVAGPPLLHKVYSSCTLNTLIMIFWYRRSNWH